MEQAAELQGACQAVPPLATPARVAPTIAAALVAQVPATDLQQAPADVLASRSAVLQATALLLARATQAAATVKATLHPTAAVLLAPVRNTYVLKAHLLHVLLHRELAEVVPAAVITEAAAHRRVEATIAVVRHREAVPAAGATTEAVRRRAQVAVRAAAIVADAAVQVQAATVLAADAAAAAVAATAPAADVRVAAEEDNFRPKTIV